MALKKYGRHNKSRSKNTKKTMTISRKEYEEQYNLKSRRSKTLDSKKSSKDPVSGESVTVNIRGKKARDTYIRRLSGRIDWTGIDTSVHSDVEMIAREIYRKNASPLHRAVDLDKIVEGIRSRTDLKTSQIEDILYRLDRDNKNIQLVEGVSESNIRIEGHSMINFGDETPRLSKIPASPTRTIKEESRKHILAMSNNSPNFAEDYIRKNTDSISGIVVVDMERLNHPNFYIQKDETLRIKNELNKTFQEMSDRSISAQKISEYAKSLPNPIKKYQKGLSFPDGQLAFDKLIRDLNINRDMIDAALVHDPKQFVADWDDLLNGPDKNRLIEYSDLRKALWRSYYSKEMKEL